MLSSLRWMSRCSSGNRDQIKLFLNIWLQERSVAPYLYIGPDGTSVFCPLYAKSVICVNRTLSSLRVNPTMSVLHDEMPHTNWRAPSWPEHPPAVIHLWHSGRSDYDAPPEIENLTIICRGTPDWMIGLHGCLQPTCTWQNCLQW
jgi:hypothetical protein